VLELTRFDDFPYHQTVSSFAMPVTADPHFNDGYYFAWYRPGEHWFCGLRLHPNNNVMDGYAGVVSGGRQRTIRVSRALRPDSDTLRVGPLSLQIISPMQLQRVALDTNRSGLSFDVEITASSPEFVEHGHTQVRHGRLFNHLIRYTQVGRATGVVGLGSESSSVERWHACRDHSWGIRSTMGPHVPIGGIESDQLDPRAIRIWIPFEVSDHTGFFFTHEDASGAALDFEGRLDFFDGTQVPLKAVHHSFRYHPGSRRLAGGEFTVVDETGGEYTYQFEAAADPAHPQGFGYTRGWSDGGQPGVYRGEYTEEIDEFPTDDPTRSLGPVHVPESRRLGGTEFTSTIVGPDGATGMAHVEHMLYGGFDPVASE